MALTIRLWRRGERRSLALRGSGGAKRRVSGMCLPDLAKMKARQAALGVRRAAPPRTEPRRNRTPAERIELLTNQPNSLWLTGAPPRRAGGATQRVALFEAVRPPGQRTAARPVQPRVRPCWVQRVT